jgi:CheY-like chemotaxis protein
MEIMDGYQASSKIRVYILEKKLLLPIIINVMGKIGDSYLNKCYRCGINMVLSKPLKINNMTGILKKLNYF